MFDYDIYKENRPITPKEILNVFDLRYLGMKKGFPTTNISSIPKRKKRKSIGLSQEEINFKQEYAKKRIS